jgi:hypothetical protein
MNKNLSLRGCLDSITSSGFAEGWAYDTAAPLRSLTVSIRHGDEEVALALAHLYRADLADAGCGTGWCAFRARLTIEPQMAREAPLGLMAKESGDVLQAPRVLGLLDDSDASISSVASLIEQDPTCLGPIERLGGCTQTVASFVKRYGAEAFVQTAYVYVVGHPADKDGATAYTNLIRQSLLEPIDLLKILSNSELYRARRHMLSAPGTPEFPFQLHES